MTVRGEKMVEATKSEIAEAKKEIAEAEKTVAEAEKKVAEAKSEFFQHSQGDAMEREILHDRYKKIALHCEIVLEQLQGATSHLNALQRRLDRSADRSQFDMMVAQSPTAKHMHSAIASVDPGAVTVWSFCHPKPELSQKDRLNLRRKAAIHYYVYTKKGKMAQCQLAKEWGNSKQVTTNHLWPHSTKHHIMDMFGIEDVNDMRNLLLLSKGVEKAFEAGQIYFEGRDDRTFVMRILDDTVKQNPIFDGSTKPVGSLEGKQLFIPKNRDPPFKRVLSHHAQDAYKKALEKGWITKARAPPEEYGSPLKDNMLSLTRATTDSRMDDAE